MGAAPPQIGHPERGCLPLLLCQRQICRQTQTDGTGSITSHSVFGRDEVGTRRAAMASSLAVAVLSTPGRSSCLRRVIACGSTCRNEDMWALAALPVPP